MFFYFNAGFVDVLVTHNVVNNNNRRTKNFVHHIISYIIIVIAFGMALLKGVNDPCHWSRHRDGEMFCFVPVNVCTRLKGTHKKESIKQYVV